MLVAVVVLVLCQTSQMLQPCLPRCSQMDMLLPQFQTLQILCPSNLLPYLHLTSKEDLQIFYSEFSKMPQCPRLLESYILMKTCNSGVLIKMPLCSTLLLCWAGFYYDTNLSTGIKLLLWIQMVVWIFTTKVLNLPTTSLSAANCDAWTDRNLKNGISELMKGHILFQTNNGSHIFL